MLGSSSRPTDCPARCPGCAEETSREAVEPGLLVGSNLVLYSILTFLLPPATALIGVGLADRHPQLQLIGGFSGLVAGMLIVRLLVIVRSRLRRSPS